MRETSALDRMAPAELAAILRALLTTHPELRAEAEAAARSMAAACSESDVAEGVFEALVALDIGELNARSGNHDGFYVAPEEAADELLAEAIEDYVADMKRQAALGLVDAAERCCKGIVAGLYRARDAKADGCLGWAPDFPMEAAEAVVVDLVKGVATADGAAVRERLDHWALDNAPAWTHGLTSAVDRLQRRK